MEQHLQLLDQQRMNMEDMLQRTNRMIAGVKRGIDEMRAASSGTSNNGNAPSVPLPSRADRNIREGGANLWPTDPPKRS